MEKPMNSDADRAARAQADSVTAPAGGAEEVDKALNDYAQAFTARAMGWTREHGDAMPDARTKLYSAISSYARGLFTTSHTPQAADSVLEDAARYRWLRENWFTMTSNYQRRITFKVGEPRWSDITEEELDAAIDAARKQGDTP